MAVPNRMIFDKFQTVFDPLPPHFRKIMLQFFYNGYGRIYAKRYEAEVSENSRSREFSTRVSFIFSRSTTRNDFLKSRSRLET